MCPVDEVLRSQRKTKAGTTWLTSKGTTSPQSAHGEAGDKGAALIVIGYIEPRILQGTQQASRGHLIVHGENKGRS